jgi:hypothetical protein
MKTMKRRWSRNRERVPRRKKTRLLLQGMYCDEVVYHM